MNCSSGSESGLYATAYRRARLHLLRRPFVARVAVGEIEPAAGGVGPPSFSPHVNVSTTFRIGFLRAQARIETE
jgi:hypothetical protein